MSEIYINLYVHPFYINEGRINVRKPLGFWQYNNRLWVTNLCGRLWEVTVNQGLRDESVKDQTQFSSCLILSEFLIFVPHAYPCSTAGDNAWVSAALTTIKLPPQWKGRTNRLHSNPEIQWLLFALAGLAPPIKLILFWGNNISHSTDKCRIA